MDRTTKVWLALISLVLVALLVTLWIGPPFASAGAAPAPGQPSAYLSTQTIIGAMIVGLFTGIIGSLFTGFFNERGKQLALTAEQQKILEQLRNATQAVKQIEADISLKRYIGETEIQYREKQLAEFYGPIYGATKLTGKIWRLYMEGKLSSIAPEVNQLFQEQNIEIAKVLKNKFYLVEGAEIPQSFQAFLTSVTLYNIGTAKGGGFSPKDIAELPEAKFPDEFFSYIENTTTKLKAELDSLYRTHRLVTTGASSPPFAAPPER
jgi:hypothetical protein